MAEPERSPKGSPEEQFEVDPLTRNEYITALVHYYRGERSRADAWRARLDPTTNWAVATTGAMLSFTFASPDQSHVSLLLANFLVLIFLGFEARRFRYFDVWRARVRMIEENFFIPIIRRNLVSPRSDWRESMARDLDHPTFKISVLEAVAIRLRFNYIWIFAAISLAWLAKLSVHPTHAQSFAQVMARMEIGPLTGREVILGWAAFWVAAVWLAIWGGGRGRHGDEVHGLEKEIEHWKT
ncbi:MAG: DUF2270 domain-containing protein [Thermoanaerobaculia bacterium]